MTPNKTTNLTTLVIEFHKGKNIKPQSACPSHIIAIFLGWWEKRTNTSRGIFQERMGKPCHIPATLRSCDWILPKHHLVQRLHPMSPMLVASAPGIPVESHRMHEDLTTLMPCRQVCISTPLDFGWFDFLGTDSIFGSATTQSVQIKGTLLQHTNARI